MLLRKTTSKRWIPWLLAAICVLFVLAAAQVASAAPCDFKNNPPPFIRHDTGNSYCELCGYGYITVEITNPYERLGAVMSNMTVVEDLGTSGLEYESSAPNAITYRLNGSPFVGPAPVISGGGAVLTFNIPDTLEAHPNNNQFNTITITFAVRRVTDPEGLSGADRTIQATLTFDTDQVPDCADSPQSDTDVLALREPQPVITKTGWNYDAGQRQGSAGDPVFGTSNDDIVWRIRIQNNGQADLQDLRFDDLMETGSMTVNYACPSEASANAVAANNGVLPGGSPCVAASNNINDFVVTGNFGASQDNTYPWGAGYEVDVVAGGSTSVYLVGKIASDGSCTTDRANTVEDVQWGCQAQSPAGGITSPESGGIPTDTARLVTRYMDGYPALRVERRLTGTNTSQPVGTKGTMTITITNNTGGSVKDIQLDDVLPPEYVVDSTYTPTINVTSPYGSYRGRVSTLEWTNPQPGTFPLVSTDPADPLANTNPTFDLTSNGDAHPLYPDQVNMLRHGDEVVITFRVVLIESNYYDRSANLDVLTEVTADGTDPPYQATLNNTLAVDFDTFCPSQPHQQFVLTGNGAGNPTGAAIPADPEDLDITIGVGVFILTGDPAQTLTLPVQLTNNGGHDAADYHAFVTFGATMDVQSAPAGCVEISPLSGSPPQPDPWKVWVKSAVPADQIAIPSTATVYECTSPAVVAPGQTVTLNFDVVKTTDPAGIVEDDLTFRADVVGEITLSDGTPLWFPTPIARADGELDRANNYSLDTVWARVIGFNLKKTQVGTCTENNPPIIDTDANGEPMERVEIGEECTYHIDTGGWFGFETPGFAYIAVQNIEVEDESPDGQGYISATNPYAASTPLIQGVTFTPAALAPVTEGWFRWTFNVTDPERIEDPDEWFRVDFTSRILNDAVNSRSAPNYHGQLSTNVLNSTFDATFFNNNTNLEEGFTLGPTTVGYPNEPIRRVDATITEPHLELVKEVCNETLYGTGTGCTNWTTLTDEGDTYDSYIFRITVRNLATSGGLASSPAYDVVVTDTLDGSDLMYVLPFDADGLDNDGDTAFDESGTNEGAISNNTVLDGTPAVITFSHSHSSALQRIDPGSQVYLYYRVDPDEHALPLQDLVNTVAGSYDTLAGSSNQSGNQTVDLRLNGDIGGARVYTDASASATVRILDVVSYPKEITGLSNTTLGSGSPQPVSIGEEIEYELAADLPVARLRSLQIQDDLPAGLRCSEAPTVNLSQPPYDAAGFRRPDGSAVPPIVPQCLDSGVTWDFGDVVLTQKPSGSSYFHFPVTFIARVDNAAANNDGDSLINGQPATTAALTYIDDLNNTITKTFGQVEVVVAEPDIALTKSFAPVVNADAGDRITVTVTAVNNGSAAAYNLRILDDLTGRDMTYVPGSTGGADPPDSVNVALFGANQPVFIWNPTRPLAPGGTFSFTFDVSVDIAAQPLEVLDNTIQADWTSLPGQTTALNSSGAIGANGGLTGMRIGALPNAGDAVNDYEATAGDQVTVPAVTLDKTDLDAAVIPAVGVHKRFTIEIRLPEGTTNNVTVTDGLDTGSVSYVLANNATYDITYTFQGIAAINGQPPAEAAFTAFPADGASGTAVWNIGTVVTQSEDDPDQSAIAPLIRIQYYGRVNNDLVTDDGDTLGNSVDTTYTNGETGGTETLTDTTSAVTAVEPVLTAVKTVSNVTTGKLPADPPAGGDLLEYTVTVLNSGTATAFDVNLVDTLPSSLELYTDFTPTAEINGSSVAGFTAIPANSPGGPLVWGRDNGDESLDIPVGQSLVLIYRCVVLAAGGDLTNRVYVDWTSLDGADTYERTGAGCPSWTAPNDYCTGPAEATTTTVDTNNIDKTVAADTYNIASDAVARVGDIITYRLAVNLSGGLTRSLTVQDTLPGGMVFAETVSINGDTTADYTPPAGGAGSNFSYAAITAASVPAAGQTGALTWTIGDVINDPFGDPTTDTLEIVYRARVMPDAGIAHVATTTLTNTVDMDYSTAAGPAATQTDSADLTVVQPVLAVTKTAVAANGDSVLDAGEIVTYTVEIANSGNAPAYDAVLEDIVPVGMRNGAATITVTEMRLLSGPVWPNLAPAYDAATGAAVWDFDSGTADQYSIPAGDTLHIVYQLQAETGIGAGLTLTNLARVTHYYSFDDDAVPAQGTATGQRQDYGTTNTASETFTTAMPDPPLKENPATTTVAVGEPFTYRITVPNTPQAVALHDVRILDDLSASAADLTFVSVTNPGTQPWTPVNTGTATSLVIEDTTTGIEIPAGDQIVVEITVVLADTGTNTTGLTFTNTAGYTFNAVDGDPGTQLDGGSDTTGPMTIVGSEALTLEKDGPGTMQVGTAATFTLTVNNPGTGTAWNPTLTDRLPNETNGGMCAAGPGNVTAQIFADAAGTTPVSPVLAQGTDYTVTFNGEPDCEWTLSLLSPSGGIGAGQYLIVTYDAELDPDTENAIVLTNYAWASQWFSADPNAPGAAPHTFTETLNSTTPGTPGTVDHEDRHDVTVQAPILQFEKRVVNVTTGQDPGSNATPGDTLRYTLRVVNTGPVGLTGFSITDDLGRLNASPVFAPNTLTLAPLPPGADASATDGAGGTNGTGLVNIASLNIGAQGDPDDTLTVVFDVTLAPAITSGTVVRNQAALSFGGQELISSDDPNLSNTAADPTETLIASAPEFQVLKTSTILSGDPNILMAGETLRYTITIKNIGTEDAVNVRLRDDTPANTTYVAGSTTLNGTAVADPSPGVNPLQAGILVNAPENTTAGYLRADATAGAANVATVTFDVVVDPDAMDGLIIANQGFIAGSGAGSGVQPEQPSDDPGTPAADDPTQNIVGNLPLLYAQKTVEIFVDNGSPDIVDPGDVLRYTIAINNFGAIPATGVVLTDPVPDHTTYVADSIRLNGILVGSDGGVLPLIAGLTVQSADNPGAGIISPGASAVVTFEARVDAGAVAGDLITNQGSVASAELPLEPTDADGVPSNGDQPTVIVVGAAQWLTVTKEVGVVGGGAALPGGQLEYTLRVTNVGSMAATQVRVTDDLSPPLGDQVTYVAGSGTLNGAAAGITYAGNVLTADYAAQYGDLEPGATAVVRFRVQIDTGLAMGTTIANTGVVHWNNPEDTAPATVSIDVGGTPGSAALNGDVWHDANLDKICDRDAETLLEGWSVALYRNNQLVTTVATDADGRYRLSGLVPNAGTTDVYELRFQAAGAGPNTPSLGTADSPFTDGPQRISAITVGSGGNLQNLNLPIWPNGTVYNSVARQPVAGATVAMLNAATGAALPVQCFDDAAQQNQVTALDGFYKFDLNFSNAAACPAGGDYLIAVTPPAAGYQAGLSQIIPPSSDATTAPFSVPACPGTANDAVPATAEYCEATASAEVPPVSVLPRTAGTIYHLHLTLGNATMPGQSQIFNNPIPLDPVLNGAVAITKTSSLINVSKASLVPYTITVTNVYGAPLYDIAIKDRFPAGFKYVKDSARLDGNPAEPSVNGLELTWGALDLAVNQKYTLRLLLVVGSGVSEGEYVNRAQVINTAMGTAVSGEASATVRVIPDPDFACTDVIGKVFDDRNLDGSQDPGENGLGGVRVVTARGLIATSDEHGRFHITCAAVPDADLGSNFILKLDERSLPTGYRLTTENPRVQRATRGKMLRFNFGATVHRVVRLDIADGVFEPGTSEVRLQWRSRIAKLLEELRKAPSVLRLSYLADVERESLVNKRLKTLKKEITSRWDRTGGGYPLAVETEIFWRRGAPVAGR